MSEYEQVSTAKSPEFVGTTTVRELIGPEVDERVDHFGLFDTPLSVTKTDNVFDVKIAREPFSAEDFINFFNQASPYGTYQDAFAIAEDWALAETQNIGRRLAKLHEKIPAWGDMITRGSSYTSLARNASKPPETRLLDYEAWLSSMPDVKPVEEVIAELAAEAHTEIAGVMEDIISERLAISIREQEIREIQSAPTMLMLKRLSRIGFDDAKEVLSQLVLAENPSRRKQHINDIVKWFARKPYKVRQRTQEQLLRVLTGVESEFMDLYIDQVAAEVAQSRLAAIGYVSGVDSEGNSGVVLFKNVDRGPYLGQAAIIDRSCTDRWEPKELNADYEADEQIVKIATRYSATSGIRIRDEVFQRNLRKIRVYEALPLIRWVNDGSESRADTSNRVESVAGAALPTKLVTDGVFGLVVVHYLSGDVELPKTLKIGGAGREQQMGAAQLPLLA